MKDKTKKLIVLGGLGAVGVYFLMGSGSEDGVGGFGGGGGLPQLPGDTEAAAEGDIINYILPTPEIINPFVGVVETAPESKKGYAEAAAVLEEAQKDMIDMASVGGSYGDIKHTSDIDLEALSKKGATNDRTLSQQAGGFVRGGAIEGTKLAVIGTGGGMDFVSSILGIDLGFETTAREGVKDWFAPKSKTATSSNKSDTAKFDAKKLIIRGERSNIVSALTSRYASRSGSGQERNDPISSMGERAYRSARSTALASTKKRYSDGRGGTTSRPGSPD